MLNILIARLIAVAIVLTEVPGGWPIYMQTNVANGWPHVSHVVAPSAPFNVVIGNTVFALATVNGDGEVSNVRVVQGVTPFAEETVHAVSQWQFTPVGRTGKSARTEVSVLVMFRPHAFGNFGVGGPTLGFATPPIPSGDHPVLPVLLFDPGWPIVSALRDGVVMFEVEIAKDGSMHEVRVLRDIPPTTDFARKTLEQWKFAPAVTGGQPVDSKIVVAISFVTPVIPC